MTAKSDCRSTRRGCAFSLGSFDVGGGVDCSAVDRDVSPGVSYCASLNRAECSLVPNT